MHRRAVRTSKLDLRAATSGSGQFTWQRGRAGFRPLSSACGPNPLPEDFSAHNGKAFSPFGPRASSRRKERMRIRLIYCVLIKIFSQYRAQGNMSACFTCR
jgi:hypothetical protein